MKVVILAGGKGTRLSEYTGVIPKPMIRIGDLPIIMHIMHRYAAYGYKDFVIALGYKGDVIKEYFHNISLLSGDCEVDLGKGTIRSLEKKQLDWRIRLIDTGEETLTGRRLWMVKEHLGEEFMVTYGDGVSSIDIGNLVKFHRLQKRHATITAVRPPARFGELRLKGSLIEEFEEKPQLHKGWINGGYMVLNKEFLDYIGGKNIMLEREPMTNACKDEQLSAFRHDGFWQCMDTKRDMELLEKLWLSGAPPWEA